MKGATADRTGVQHLRIMIRDVLQFQGNSIEICAPCKTHCPYHVCSALSQSWGHPALGAPALRQTVHLV